MANPLIAREFAFILGAVGCLNLATVSLASRLRARCDRLDRSETDDSDELLRAAEALSAQYEAIAGGDRRRAGE